MNARVIIASVIPAALLMAMIYGIRGTWSDIRTKKWVWAAIGLLTTLTAILGLILIGLVLMEPAY